MIFTYQNRAHVVKRSPTLFQHHLRKASWIGPLGPFASRNIGGEERPPLDVGAGAGAVSPEPEPGRETGSTPLFNAKHHGLLDRLGCVFQCGDRSLKDFWEDHRPKSIGWEVTLFKQHTQAVNISLPSASCRDVLFGDLYVSIV